MGEEAGDQLGRGGVAAAGQAVNGAVDEALREAAGDPRRAAQSLLQRLRADAALTDALRVSFAGGIAAMTKQDIRRRR